jgi:hypothetical protein
MKPDWQNKSFAKGGAATGPSTMHSKLKVGMSSLHSKIGQANSNMPQAPKPATKPAVRKFADGGMVRGGVMSDEAYAKQMEEGAKNMERLRSAADSIKSFFSSKEAPTSASNITGDTGMSAADEAKKSAMSGGYQIPKAEEKRREMTDYMVKPTETESKTEIKATPVETGPAPAPAPAPVAKKVVAKKKPVSRQQNANVQKSSAPAPKVKAPAPKVEAPAPAPAPKPVAQKTSAPATKTVRDASGKMVTVPVEQEASNSKQWGVQNVVPNLKGIANKVEKSLNSPDGKWGVQNVIPNIKGAAKSVSNYMSNFETPAERRARLAKEGK